MKPRQRIRGTFFKMKEEIPDLSEFDVLIGFAGWGNVGYYSVNHLVETLKLETFAAWGNSSWFYKGRLESIVTVYIHETSKTLLVASRVPIPVTSVNPQNWDEFATELLSWNCKRYIIVGGIREETRAPDNSDWVAYAPNFSYTQKFGVQRTFGERLAMVGPLSSFLVIGTSLQIPVMGLLAYCNYEEDPEASTLILSEFKEIVGQEITGPLKGFDHSFVPIQQGSTHTHETIEAIFQEDEDEVEEEDFDGFDPDDLL